jgi:hypothetical protein
MVSSPNGTRRLLTVIAALGLLFTLGTPPRAAEASGAIAIQAAYSRATAAPGEEVTLTMNFYSSHEIGWSVAGTVQFPSSATVTLVNSPSCDFVGSGSGGLVTYEILVVAGGSCEMLIDVIFSETGSYTGADHNATAVAGTTFELVDILLSFFAEITIADEVVEPTSPPAPAVCELTPDMAVSPELIDLAPGGTAVIELAMRNLCPDAPTPSGDLLLSLSDGLSVVDQSAGVTNLGPRAAVQNFTLLPDETRRWTVTVSAAEQLIAAPQHITEYYTGGRVMSRIDGVFITPAPAPAAAAAPAPVIEAAAAAPAAPAPIPAALPNTAGESSPLPVAPALLLAAAAAAFTITRRRSTR